MSLTISFPAKVVEPGSTVLGPFGTNTLPSTETDPTITVVLSDSTVASIQAMIAGGIPASQTAVTVASAAAQLTIAQLSQAIAARAAAGGS